MDAREIAIELLRLAKTLEGELLKPEPPRGIVRVGGMLARSVGYSTLLLSAERNAGRLLIAAFDSGLLRVVATSEPIVAALRISNDETRWWHVFQEARKWLDQSGASLGITPVTALTRGHGRANAIRAFAKLLRRETAGNPSRRRSFKESLRPKGVSLLDVSHVLNNITKTSSADDRSEARNTKVRWYREWDRKRPKFKLPECVGLDADGQTQLFRVIEVADFVLAVDADAVNGFAGGRGQKELLRRLRKKGCEREITFKRPPSHNRPNTVRTVRKKRETQNPSPANRVVKRRVS